MVASGIKIKKHNTEPVWAGPAGEGTQGGVTQSLLGRWLCCRERFRILTMEGLKPQESFNHKLEYGNMWHVCEESLAAQFGAPSIETGWQPTSETTKTYKPWSQSLLRYTQDLCRRYPTQQGEIDKWYNACRLQFPIYVDFWARHPDVTQRTPLFQEQVFDVMYSLPSKRKVRLRGKWDSGDLIGAVQQGGRVDPHAGTGVWLQENKTKGDVREGQIQRQLSFDIQTMLYLVALHWTNEHDEEGNGLSRGVCRFGAPVLGVRYNVIRRPFSGGKGNIVQGKGSAGTKCPKCKGEGKCVRALDVSRGDHFMKTCEKCGGKGRIGGKPPESKEAFYTRAGKYIQDEPETYFFRWSCRVLPGDVARFRKECLDPILENLLDDYEWWRCCKASKEDILWNGLFRRQTFPHHCPRHFRLPFGTYNALAEGGSSELDGYLETGDETGLERVMNLFPEL